MIRREAEYFFGALRFFTRLPTPAWVGHSDEAMRQSARYFPAVGLVVGGMAAGVYWAAAQLWPPMLAVLLAMAATLLITGAFHEDGLSDTADGLGGGWEKTRILAIMKDSRVGSYGVVALWLALTGKFALLTSLAPAIVPAALLAGHSFSRLCATGLMVTMDYARDDAQSKSRPMAARMSAGAFAFAALFALPPLILLPLSIMLSGVVLALLVTVWLARKCQRWLGGYTGDCLGAVQQVSEIGFYLGLIAGIPQ